MTLSSRRREFLVSIIHSHVLPIVDENLSTYEKMVEDSWMMGLGKQHGRDQFRSLVLHYECLVYENSEIGFRSSTFPPSKPTIIVNSLQFWGGFSSNFCFFVSMFQISNFVFLCLSSFSISLRFHKLLVVVLTLLLWRNLQLWSTSTSFKTILVSFQIFVNEPKSSSKVAYESTSKFLSSPSFWSLGLEQKYAHKKFE